AEQVDHVGAERRVRCQFLAHPIRDRDEQRGHRREEQRQQQRALHRDDRRRRSAREVDRRRARDRNLEPQPIDGENHRQLNRRKPSDEIPAARRQQAPNPDAEEACEQDEVREIREQTHVRRHPPDDGGLEKEDEKRGDEEQHRGRLLLESRPMTNPTRRLVSRAIVVTGLAAMIVGAARHPHAASAPSLSPAGEEAIGARRRQKVAAGMPAIAVVVVNARQQLLIDAAGHRDVAAHAALATDSIFRIASMTKPVTSLAVMMLVEEGRVRVDDPVAKYLPQFERVRVLTTFNEADGRFESRPPARPITIRHLLTHTSGMAYPFVDRRIAKIDDGKKARAEVPLLHDPGERFTYGPSTAGLGLVVEKVSGRRLDEFVKARIFDPLGMVDTFYAVPADKHDRVVTLHARSDADLVERPNPATIASNVAGDGGLLSTAADYGRFM